MKASLSVALLLASTAYAAPLLNGNLLSNINNNRAPHGLLSRVGVILAGDRSAPLVNADLKRHNSIKQSELPKDLGEVARDFEQLKRFETLQEAGEMRLKDEDFPGARALPKKQFEKAPGIQGLLSRLVRRGDYGSYGGHDDEEGEDDNDNKKDCKKDGGEEGDDDDNDDNDNDVGDYNGHGYQGGKRHDGEGNDDDDEGDDDDDDKDGYGRLGYGGNGNPKGKYNGSYNAGGEEGDNDDDDDDGDDDDDNDKKHYGGDEEGGDDDDDDKKSKKYYGGGGGRKHGGDEEGDHDGKSPCPYGKIWKHGRCVKPRKSHPKTYRIY